MNVHHAGEQRQARGGCMADLVLVRQAPGEAPGSMAYTFATAASLRAPSGTPVPTPTQQVRRPPACLAICTAARPLPEGLSATSRVQGLLLQCAPCPAGEHPPGSVL